MSRPFEELRDSGLLWLINVSVLHPRGFALGLAYDEAGAVVGWELLGDGTEPWMFDPQDPELAQKFAAAMRTLACPIGGDG